MGNPIFSSAADIDAAGRVIRQGGLVVFPTETVYGLGADAQNAGAVARIFAAKGRPADNPLIVHVAEISWIGRVAGAISPAAQRLLSAFAPGPVTLVLPARADLPRAVTAGLDTVAVRVPAHPIAQALLRAAGVPLAAPSANRSGTPSPTTMAMAQRSLGDAADAYLDGGPCAVGLESTVISVRGDEAIILRPGAVTEADIRGVLPEVTVCAGPGGASAADQGARSPGMRHQHYRPAAPVVVWDSAAALRDALAGQADSPRPTMVIAPHSMEIGEHDLARIAGGRVVLRAYADLAEYGRRLYAWFAESDAVGAERVLAHLPPGDGLGAALRDRLVRASGKTGDS
jgi:L-threonylcarbamoyladenylate synthase